jgi:transposase-like protein
MSVEQDRALAVLRDLFERITDPEWIGGVSRQITDAIHAELPELDADEDLRLGTYASTESVLRLMADLVALGRPPGEAEPPPAAVDYAREFVRRGVSIDALLRSYHVGHATFFRNWVARAREEVPEPSDQAVAIELGAVWTFDYVQALSRGLVARYADERDQWVRSAAALRAETVRSLLGGDPIDVRAASQRLRYELDRQHVAFVVWFEETTHAESDFATLERVALSLATDLGPGTALVLPFGHDLVAAWIGHHDPIAVPDTPRLAFDPGAEGAALVAFGSPGVGVEGFCRSHREAIRARRVAQLAGRRPGSVSRYEDVALVAVGSVDLQLARDFVTAELGPLAGSDDESVRLAATLRAYLEENASPRRTAQRLGVHENTIKNRVRAITEMLGQAPEPRVAELLLALRLARVTHR